MVSVISQRSSLTNLSFSDQLMMKKININTLTQCLKQLHQFEEILCTTSSIEDLSQHNALKVSKTTLFRNSGFMLKLMLQRNASKFALFLEYENFNFTFHATSFFPLMNASNSLGENKNVARNKIKKTMWVFVFQKYGKFSSVSLEH